MSFRVYSDNLAEYYSCLRDRQIEHEGLRVTIHEPIDQENTVDFYGDPEISNRKDRVVYMIPIYRDYFEILDVLGTDAENDLPLECLIKTSDHIPRETVFRLPVRNDAGDLIDRFWRVIGSELRHLDLGYQKIIKCVPARGDHCGSGVC